MWRGSLSQGGCVLSCDVLFQCGACCLERDTRHTPTISCPYSPALLTALPPRPRAPRAPRRRVREQRVEDGLLGPRGLVRLAAQAAFLGVFAREDDDEVRALVRRRVVRLVDVVLAELFEVDARLRSSTRIRGGGRLRSLLLVLRGDEEASPFGSGGPVGPVEALVGADLGVRFVELALLRRSLRARLGVLRPGVVVRRRPLLRGEPARRRGGWLGRRHPRSFVVVVCLVARR
mmetsp:Transcript_19697/g.78427  ORF Transcript_19697/g.78427 Transcript_19697/m.78427 type:complete len:233 (-) Transcript_19697:1080-1778(-)